MVAPTSAFPPEDSGKFGMTSSGKSGTPRLFGFRDVDLYPRWRGLVRRASSRGGSEVQDPIKRFEIEILLKAGLPRADDVGRPVRHGLQRQLSGRDPRQGARPASSVAAPAARTSAPRKGRPCGPARPPAGHPHRTRTASGQGRRDQHRRDLRAHLAGLRASHSATTRGPGSATACRSRTVCTMCGTSPTTKTAAASMYATCLAFSPA